MSIEIRRSRYRQPEMWVNGSPITLYISASSGVSGDYVADEIERLQACERALRNTRDVLRFDRTNIDVVMSALKEADDALTAIAAAKAGGS